MNQLLGQILGAELLVGLKSLQAQIMALLAHSTLFLGPDIQSVPLGTLNLRFPYRINFIPIACVGLLINVA